MRMALCRTVQQCLCSRASLSGTPQPAQRTKIRDASSGKPALNPWSKQTRGHGRTNYPQAGPESFLLLPSSVGSAIDSERPLSLPPGSLRAALNRRRCACSPSEASRRRRCAIGLLLLVLPSPPALVFFYPLPRVLDLQRCFYR